MVGYNLQEAKNVISKVRDNYIQLDKSIVSGWEALKRKLRSEWIGYDEEDFEKKFAQRLIELSVAASEMTNNSMQTIYNLAKAWHDFQAQNTLDGGKLEIESFNLEFEPTSPRNSESIPAGGLTLSDGTTRGLKNGTASAGTLQEAVSSFVNNIRQKAENLANSISTERAFSGEQSTAIKNYLKKCGEVSAAIATSVDDLNTAIDTLLRGNYAASMEKVSEEFESATSSLNSTLNDISSGRWE